MGKKKKPKVPAPTPTPQPASQELIEAGNRERERLRRMKGRSSTILTDPSVIKNIGGVAKTLLGE